MIAASMEDLRRRLAAAEAALHESESRLRSVLRSMDEGYVLADVVFDGDGRAVDIAYVESNAAATHMIGTDLRGRRLSEVDPDREARWYETWGRVAVTGEGERLERHASPQGRWYDVHVFKPEPAEAGSRRVAAVFRDISDRKIDEMRLRDSEERLRQFGEASQDVLWIRDAETLRWEYLTPAFEAIYGLSRREALSSDSDRNWLDLILPEDRPRAVESARRAVGGEQVAFEYRIRRPVDGEVRWLRNTGFPMRDADGRVRRIGGVGQDVTDLKATEAALTRSERRLRTLVEGVPQLVWRAVDGGRWTWASPQWTAFTGQPEPDSHGLGWLDPVHPDDRGAAMGGWAGAVDRGEFRAEYRVRAAAGARYRWFQARARPVHGERGAGLEWLGTSTDVDDLRRLQDEQSVLVAELQHRTRNLIAVVKGMAVETMRETGPSEAFCAAFADRLSALSRVQGLLSRAGAEPITFGSLLELELGALGASSDGRVTVGGPEAFLRPSTVQTLALALHGLAADAKKHGALSHDGGRLAVTWLERSEAGESRLAIAWVETGLERAPGRPGPGRGRGEHGQERQSGQYGRDLIEQALPHALGARTSYALTASGVRCTIDLAVRPGRGQT